MPMMANGTASLPAANGTDAPPLSLLQSGTAETVRAEKPQPLS